MAEKIVNGVVYSGASYEGKGSMLVYERTFIKVLCIVERIF